MSAVQFQLDGVDDLVRKFTKVSPLRNVLPDQPVGEVHGSVQFAGNLLVFAELGAVVGGDGQDIPVPSRQSCPQLMIHRVT